MTLQDFDGGRVAAVSYDSHDPIDRTLSSFAINLNNNPTLAQILTQARGEKVEVAGAADGAVQPGTLTGHDHRHREAEACRRAATSRLGLRRAEPVVRRGLRARAS